jgi:hypothetical protein
MDGLYFLLSIVGVGLVMWWTAQNDRVDIDKPTTGLFSMPARGRVKARKSRGVKPLVVRPLEEVPQTDRPRE